MSSALGFAHRNWQILVGWFTEAPKSEDALKFGILGAANIAPFALISPAKSHPEVVIHAIAARDKKRAIAYARKHGIPEVLDSYEALLDDPSIDAVYIPLPVSLHFEWAHRALSKGKHVLLEKPAGSNAAEAEILFRSPLLGGPGAPVILEAFHFRFQPSWALFLSLLDQPNVSHATSTMTAPAMFMSKDNIRFNYSLGGGAIADLGTYPLAVLRCIFGAEPEACVECEVETMEPPSELCDYRFDASFRFPNGGTGEAHGNLRATLSEGLPFVEVRHRETVVPDDSLPAGQEKTRTRSIRFVNFAISAFYHSITVTDDFVVRDKETKEAVRSWTSEEVRKAYTFEEAGIDSPSQRYWLSYRHQLEQFVDRVRGREGSGMWVDGEDSIAQARMIDMAYEKSGLPLRMTSDYKP